MEQCSIISKKYIFLKTEVSKKFLYFYHEIEIRKKVIFSQNRNSSTLSKKILKMFYILLKAEFLEHFFKNFNYFYIYRNKNFQKNSYIHLKQKFLKHFYI